MGKILIEYILSFKTRLGSIFLKLYTGKTNFRYRVKILLVFHKNVRFNA